MAQNSKNQNVKSVSDLFSDSTDWKMSNNNSKKIVDFVDNANWTYYVKNSKKVLDNFHRFC